MANLEEILENFEFLDDWDDRYKYLIELGNQLEPFPDALQNDSTKVQGCVSQVWIACQTGKGQDPVINFIGTSDAHIVRGLIAIALAIFSGKKASAIGAIDETQIFGQLDLSEHITPQRSNGLLAMVARIKEIASSASKAENA